MKIALVVWDLSISGGTQRQAVELARGLGRLGHEVTVFAYAFDPEVCYPELVGDLKVVSLVRGRAKKPARARFLDYALIQFHRFDGDIRRLARSIPAGFDVLNPHDLYAERVAYFYKLRHKTPAVWMSNDVPVIFQIRENEKHNPDRLTTAKSKLVHGVKQLFLKLEEWRERRFVSAINEVVVLDHRNQRQFREFMHRSALVVRSGLDIQKFSPKHEKSNPVFTILGTGIMFRLRRFEDLIAATQLLAADGLEVRLNIIGSEQFDPAYALELHEQAAAAGVSDKVQFLGRVSEEELRRQYRDADVFAFPNHRQTWGLAVFEAMASGTPVIVSRTAGAHEVIEDGETGLLVDPRQPGQIAEQVKRLMREPALREKLSRQGRAYVEREITWDHYTRNMVRVFEDTLRVFEETR